MFKKALVGVDPSPAEMSLLSCLPDLARWGIESMILAHVIRVGYVQGAEYGHEEECRSWLEERAAPLRSAGLSVTTSITDSGVPADELLALARAEEADLLVVGSRSNSFLEEIFLGSVARELIRKSELPVLVESLEPTQTGDGETCAAICTRALERILLATDLSAQSRSAEDAAVRLAGKAGHIDCLTVLAADAGDDERQAAQSRHEDLVRRIKDGGADASTGSRIEQGDPAEVIARTGQEGYSLIIVGKHGRNWVADKIIGSTAARVCEIARRPVLMMPLQEE
ncbi:MAG: universal stress protein [Gammaproteobacteria bacterium]|nr:universal stress protein [Gammaproteobacteria bacterium]